MKKGILKIMLAALCSSVFVFGFAACGGGNDSNNGNDNNNEGGGTTTAEHTLTEHKAKDATCTESGNLAYWECTDCGKLFSDKDGKTETTLAAVTIAATGHTLTKTDGKPATCKDEGITEYWTCTVCEKLFSDGEGKTEITQADTVIPVTDNHTYGEWKSDNSGHWKECEVCGKAEEKADHDFGDGLICACGYKYNPAEDTAPATLDELFPDETTATAVELARAEYYQKVVQENFEIIYNYIKSNYITKNAETISYKFDFSNKNIDIIDTAQFSIHYNDKRTNNLAYMVWGISFPEPLSVADLYNETIIASIEFEESYKDITQKYSYIYAPDTQGDKDEFIKAVADKLDPDFDYTAPETMWLYTDKGSTLDDDYGTCRNFTLVLINNFGVRQFSIITPNIQDSELVSYIQKDEFKLNGKAEIDFSKYQINVDLTETPADTAEQAG